MCYNCGCRRPTDDMGDSSNITLKSLEKLSSEWKIPLDEAKKVVYTYSKKGKTPHDSELDVIFQKASKAWGQSIDDAKRNTQSLLEKELQNE